MRAALTYRNLPVKLKLHLIIMGTVCTALMLACAAVLIYDHFVLYKTMENDLDILAEIFASNSRAALTFDDPEAAQELLSGLKAKRCIESAVIYSARDRVFASYSRDNRQSPPPPPRFQTDTHALEGNRLKLFQRILTDNQPIGAIYFESDLGELHAQLKQSAEVILIILLAVQEQYDIVLL